MCTFRARCLRSPVTSAVFPQHPLLTKLNIMPLGKGKTFKGPRSIFIEHAERLNSKLRDNKPVTNKEMLFFLILKRLELSIVYSFIQVRKLI